MPYGIAVTRTEADIIRTIWGVEGVDMIRAVQNIIWFDPRRGKSIVTAIADYDFGDDRDPNAVRRLLERIASLCGKSLLTPASMPVAPEPESVHIEEEETEANDATDSTTTTA